MKIVKKINGNYLKDLNTGTVFRYKNKYYIKTNRYCYDKRRTECVNLETGNYTLFDDSILIDSIPEAMLYI